MRSPKSVNRHQKLSHISISDSPGPRYGRGSVDSAIPIGVNKVLMPSKLCRSIHDYRRPLCCRHTKQSAERHSLSSPRDKIPHLRSEPILDPKLMRIVVRRKQESYILCVCRTRWQLHLPRGSRKVLQGNQLPPGKA